MPRFRARPRHARKEVREIADWLDDEGWSYVDDDQDGHTIWCWPATGETLKLPETPNGGGWKQRTRAEARKVMGILDHGKRNTANVRTRAAVARSRDRTLTLAQQAQREQYIAAKQERARQLAEERDFLFYDRLMRSAPGR